MIEIWKLLGGIAFFLIGMNFLEESIQHLSGRSFKLFIKKHTSSNFKALSGGVISAAVLQSSSVVNLMALAFVGANIIQMQYALALVVGANFGTTLSSWIIAGLGFSLNIENIALSVSGLFGIGMMLGNKESRWYQWNKLLFGFGFLFLGLSYITAAMDEFVRIVDLSEFNHLSAIILMLLGFFFTALIQSSTATVALLLSALHVNAISLITAMAILLGSEVGTAIKLIIASINGPAEKKQVAFGNLFFNLLTIIPPLFFLSSIEYLILKLFHVTNKLYGLALFQSMINLMGILIIFPFLKLLGKYIVKIFTAKDAKLNFINIATPDQTAIALKALSDELNDFLKDALIFAKNIFESRDQHKIEIVIKNKLKKKGFYEGYDHLKAIHGFCHEYAIRVEKFNTLKENIGQLSQMISSNRNTMYALKSIKDAYPDIRHLMNSSNNIKFGFFEQTSVKAASYCSRMLQILKKENQSKNFIELKKLHTELTHDYSEALDKIYDENISVNLSELEISTLINYNRVIYSALKSFIIALKDHLLKIPEAMYFDKIPGFIR